MLALNEVELNHYLNDHEKTIVFCNSIKVGDCRKMIPSLFELEKELNLEIIKFDAYKNDKYLKELGVLFLPSILIFENKKLINKKSGLLDYQNLKEL